MNAKAKIAYAMIFNLSPTSVSEEWEKEGRSVIQYPPYLRNEPSV